MVTGREEYYLKSNYSYRWGRGGNPELKQDAVLVSVYILIWIFTGVLASHRCFIIKPVTAPFRWYLSTRYWLQKSGWRKEGEVGVEMRLIRGATVKRLRRTVLEEQRENILFWNLNWIAFWKPHLYNISRSNFRFKKYQLLYYVEVKDEWSMQRTEFLLEAFKNKTRDPCVET